MTDPSSREERREVEATSHRHDSLAWSTSGPTASSSAPPGRTHRQRDQPSAHEALRSSDGTHSCPERMGGFQPQCFSLSRIFALNESSTSGAAHSQGKSENSSEQMTYKEERSLGVRSSWTLLQRMCQEVSGDRGSKQTRQNEFFCCILSESVCSQERAAALKVYSGQHAEEELAAQQVSSVESPRRVSTEGSMGWGYLCHRLSDLYKDTSSHLLQAGTKAIHQARHGGSLWYPSGLTSHLMTFIRRLPFVEHLGLDMPLKSHWMSSESHSFPTAEKAAVAIRPVESVVPFRAPGLMATEAPGSSPGSVVRLEAEDAWSSAFTQTLVQFPEQMLTLQECPLKDFLELVACSLPELGGNIHEVRGVYWLAAANCTEPDPQPACVLLLPSTLYALVLSHDQLGSMGVFHALPLLQLREIQVGFGGQHIRFLSSAEGLLLTVFTYSKHLCQQICHDLLGVLVPKADAAACTSHPLLQHDLVQLSLDWKAEVPDLVLTNGVRLSSKFHNTLVDMIYFLHGNMEGSIPSLAEVQLLLYTTVRVEGDSGQGFCRSLVLLNTHIALVREDQVFYPRTLSLNTPPPGTRFEVIRCRALCEFRCLVVPEKETLPTFELVFLRKLRLPSSLRNSLCENPREAPTVQLFPSPLCPQGSENGVPEVWKLTFNSQDEALWLMSCLTRL